MTHLRPISRHVFHLANSSKAQINKSHEKMEYALEILLNHPTTQRLISTSMIVYILHVFFFSPLFSNKSYLKQTLLFHIVSINTISICLLTSLPSQVSYTNNKHTRLISSTSSFLNCFAYLNNNSFCRATSWFRKARRFLR